MSAVGRALKLYWRTWFTIIYPLILLPIFLINNTRETRCFYTATLMAGYWVFDVLPHAIVSLIPMVLYPLMGILDSGKTSILYLTSVNILFIGVLVIGLAITRSNLHARIFFSIMKLCSFSFKWLHLCLFIVTTLLSMWIPNVMVTTAMMTVIQPLLSDLEKLGLCKVFEETPEGEDTKNADPLKKKPTKLTICFHISIAYAANIGGIGSLVGTPTNIVLKGIYRDTFHKEDLTFNKWIQANILTMFSIMCVTCLWLQIWYLGLFRPKSKAAETIKIEKEGKEAGTNLIKKKLEEMGDITTLEVLVGWLFLLALVLWFLRWPKIFQGWPQFITESRVGDSCPTMIIVILFFVLPSNLDFRNAFSKDETKRPKEAAPSLLQWSFVQKNLPWNLVFLLAGGIVITEGARVTTLGVTVAEHLAKAADYLPKYGVFVISCLVALVLTQFCANCVAANIVLPPLAYLSKVKKNKYDPIYLMGPCLACSLAFCLPISSFSNGQVATACNMKSVEMLKVGLVIALLSYGILVGIFPFLQPLIWDKL